MYGSSCLLMPPTSWPSWPTIKSAGLRIDESDDATLLLYLALHRSAFLAESTDIFQVKDESMSFWNRKTEWTRSHFISVGVCSIHDGCVAQSTSIILSGRSRKKHSCHLPTPDSLSVAFFEGCAWFASYKTGPMTRPRHRSQNLCILHLCVIATVL